MINILSPLKIGFIIGVSLVVAIGPFLSAWGGYDEGMAAYEKKDYEAALKEWEPLAEQENSVDAQYMLGKMYLRGEGVLKDYAEAAKWIRKAAEYGDPDAQSDLGKLYMVGRGLTRVLVWAHMWFDLAAINGKTSAIQSRNHVRRFMAKSHIKKAQRLAREWLEKHKQK